MPLGGDCGGCTMRLLVSCETGWNIAGKKTGDASSDKTCGAAEVITTGGIWGAAVQQLCFELLLGTL